MSTINIFLLGCNVVEELSELHKKRLLVHLDGDEAQQKRDIDDQSRTIKGLLQDICQLLHSFKFGGTTVGISRCEKVVRNNIQRSLATKLQDLSIFFRDIQKVQNYANVFIRVSLFKEILSIVPFHHRNTSVSFNHSNLRIK